MDWLKAIHVGSVILSGAGFFGRGVLMFAESPVLARPWIKILPHIVDTVLLVSAVLLVLRIAQYPLTHGWLTAKVVGLVVYVGLGLVALRFGRTTGQRAAAWAGALVVFAYIVSVAVTRQPWGFV